MALGNRVREELPGELRYRRERTADEHHRAGFIDDLPEPSGGVEENKLEPASVDIVASLDEDTAVRVCAGERRDERGERVDATDPGLTWHVGIGRCFVGHDADAERGVVLPVPRIRRAGRIGTRHVFPVPRDLVRDLTVAQVPLQREEVDVVGAALEQEVVQALDLASA